GRYAKIVTAASITPKTKARPRAEKTNSGILRSFAVLSAIWRNGSAIKIAQLQAAPLYRKNTFRDGKERQQSGNVAFWLVRTGCLTAPAPDEFDGRNGNSNDVCDPIRESVRPRFGCSRDTFCCVASPWGNSAFAQRTGSPTVGSIIRERSPLWAFSTNEAAR